MGWRGVSGLRARFRLGSKGVRLGFTVYGSLVEDFPSKSVLSGFRASLRV